MDAARAEDIVPPGLLEIPSTEDCRGVWKHEAAVLLDGYLRRLARQEARGRRVLGLLAARLQATHAHQALGFVRLGDYTRERLGLSGREVQTLSRTGAALEKLPLLARAFDEGRVCWTKARLLATVADVESEAVWLEAAARMNGAELEAAVKVAREKAASDRTRAREAARADGSNTSDAANGAIAAGGLGLLDLDGDDDDSPIDGEPRAIFTLRCPRRLQAMWRRMVELARCVAGSELVQWQAAEAIAAEGLTAGEIDRSSLGRDSCGGLGGDGDQRGDHLVRVASGPSAHAATASLSLRVAERRSSRGGAMSIDGADRAAAESRLPHGSVTSIDGACGAAADHHTTIGVNDDDEYGESLASSRAALDWTPLADLTPIRIEALAAGLDSLDPYALDARMRQVVDSMQRTDSQLGRLLFTFSRLTLHRELGFHDSTSYLRDRLGISVRKARALVRLEWRSVRTAPALVDAYRRGDISWLKALVLLPVVSESHGRAWVERAQKVTLQRLADEVAWARELSDCARSTIDVAPPLLGCRLGPGIGMVGVPDPDRPGEMVQVQIGAHAGAVAVAFAAGAGGNGAVSCNAAAESAANGQVQFGARLDVPVMFATGAARASAASSDCDGKPGADGRVQFGARRDLASTVAVRSECKRVQERDLSDRGGELSPCPESVFDGLGIRDLCDGRIQLEGPASVVALLVEAVRAFTKRDEAPWRGMERLLRHVERTWHALPRHRDPVFARDGWRCRVPACSSRRNLHDHHLTFRSQGGSNDRSNRVSVCASHHHQGIHRGVIRAYGKADGGITWQIGLSRGRGPLMVLCDDTYVSTDERRMTTGVQVPETSHPQVSPATRASAESVSQVSPA